MISYAPIFPIKRGTIDIDLNGVVTINTHISERMYLNFITFNGPILEIEIAKLSNVVPSLESNIDYTLRSLIF